MVKRFLSIVVLVSMILHCSSRLGLLSYLYKQRHSIAYSVGMITEIPIAMCNSDYDFGKGIKISADADQKLPAFAVAHEMTLFFVTGFKFIQPNTVLLLKQKASTNSECPYLTPERSVFHPPSANA